MESVGLIPVNELKLIRIKNTLKLDVIEVSSAYREEIAERTDLEMLSDARAMRFDRDGNLPPIEYAAIRLAGDLETSRKRQTTPCVTGGLLQGGSMGIRGNRCDRE